MKLVDFINIHMEAISSVWERYYAVLGKPHPDYAKCEELRNRANSLWDGLWLGQKSWASAYVRDSRTPRSLSPEDYDVLKGIDLLDFEKAIPALEKVVTKRHDRGYWYNYDGLHNSKEAVDNVRHYKVLREVMFSLRRLAEKVSAEEGIHIPMSKGPWPII